MANSYFDAILPQSTGVDILNTANDAARSDRSARIAELERELAEIRKQKAQFSEEGEMGKYKFLYDADPSTYTTYKQSLRNAEQTENVRKATDDATKQSNLQQLWKQNGIELETALYDVAAAENAYNEANANKDEDAIKRADIDRGRAKAKLNRLKNEHEILRSKLMGSLGISAVEDSGKPEAGTPKDNVGGPKENLKADLDAAAEMEIVEREIGDLKALVKTDNVKIDQTEKDNNVKEWTAKADELENKVKQSQLSEKNKTPMLNAIRDIREAIRNYAKPGDKDGQDTKLTKEKARKAVYNKDGTRKNRTKLEDLGSKQLREYADLLGEDFSAIIDDLERKGK